MKCQGTVRTRLCVEGKRRIIWRRRRRRCEKKRRHSLRVQCFDVPCSMFKKNVFGSSSRLPLNKKRAVTTKSSIRKELNGRYIPRRSPPVHGPHRPDSNSKIHAHPALRDLQLSACLEKSIECELTRPREMTRSIDDWLPIVTLVAVKATQSYTVAVFPNLLCSSHLISPVAALPHSCRPCRVEDDEMQFGFLQWLSRACSWEWGEGWAIIIE